MQSFSKLKGVFPGRITLLRKNPEPTESDNGEVNDSVDDSIRIQNESVSEDLGQGSGCGVTAPEILSPLPVAQTDSVVSQPSDFTESRRKKFETILSKPIVDLVSLQEVRSQPPAACSAGVPSRHVSGHDQWYFQEFESQILVIMWMLVTPYTV